MPNKYIAFDFDGTIQHLFNKDTYSFLIDSLSQTLKDYNYNISLTLANNYNSIFEKISKGADETNKNNLLVLAHDCVTNYEVDAFKNGKPINGVISTISSLIAEGNQVAIVSNNSTIVLRKFVEMHFHNDCIYTIGRDEDTINKLKPNPFFLQKLVELYNCKPEKLVFIGDSMADYHCAKETGCKFIAFSSPEHKKDRFESTDDIIKATSYDEIYKLINKD